VRFAVLGDIQGNATALSAVLDSLPDCGPALDGVVCAGDVVGCGPQPNEVVDLLRERTTGTVLGNYDDAVAFNRGSSGRDFPDEQAEGVDRDAIAWTRSTLTPENAAWLQQLPRDLRIGPGAGGLTVKGNALDERAKEYRRTFFMRALMGGAFRTPVAPGRRVLLVHGSPRALNEFVRAETAQSILRVIVRDSQSDVLISGHAASSFRRDVEGVVFIGVGPVDGGNSAEYALLDVSDSVSVDFKSVPYDVHSHVSALRASGLPPSIVEAAVTRSSLPASG
jgi:predicted phosphodiesterase